MSLLELGRGGLDLRALSPSRHLPSLVTPHDRYEGLVVHDPAVQNTHQSVGTWTSAEEEHTIKSGVRDSDGEYEGVEGFGVM
ncbi:hypothetical protein WG66_009486 [Moniliophthora roreri]|nr:hypothetical protein WG66_009486 [Moniliophthora roreri]